MDSKFKVEISLDGESKKLLREVLKHLKQLKEVKAENNKLVKWLANTEKILNFPINMKF